MKTAALLMFVLLTASFMGTTAAALYGQHAVTFDSTGDTRYAAWRADALAAYMADTTRGAVYDSLMLALNDQIFEDKFGAYAPPLIKQSDDRQGPITGAASLALEVQPNPTDGTATFQWQTSVEGQVKITITDALGRVVATAFNGYSRGGVHSARFDCSDLMNGIY